MNAIGNKVTSGNFTVSSGNVVLSAGNVALPTTSSTVGQITLNSVAWLHGYGTDNVFLGNTAGNFTLSGTKCVAIGTNAGKALTSAGTDSVFIGYDAGSGITSSGTGQISIGSGCCKYRNSSGVAIGQQAMGGASNSGTQYGTFVAIGYQALYGANGYNYSYGNLAIGYQSLLSGTDNGTSDTFCGNCAYGYCSGRGLTYGNFNTMLGNCDDNSNRYGAGSALTAYDSYNLLLGHQGVAGDANTIRIGWDPGVTYPSRSFKTYVYGIYRYTGTLGATNCAVVIDSNGQIQAARSYAASATGKTLSILKSRGSEGTPAAITSGDNLGIIDFRGHDGTGYIVGSQITSTNSGTVATNRIASDLKFYTHPDSTTASTLRMTIADTGCVTIAAADSGTELTVTGEISATTMYATTFDTNVAAAGVTLAGTTLAADGSDTDINITITPKGAGTIVSAAVYSKQVTSNVRTLLVDDGGLIGNATSSLRFKNDVKDMGDDSSAIYKLRPVTFTYKTDDKKKKQYGLIAEEVDKVMPLLVSYDEQGRPHSVSYHDLPQILLNEVIKMRKEIDDLKAQLKGK